MLSTLKVVESLGISKRTFDRWLAEMQVANKKEWTDEEFDFFKALRDRLGQTPRVSVKAAVAELQGETADQDDDRAPQNLSLEENLIQNYTGAAVQLGSQIANTFMQVLDMTVYSELNRLAATPNLKRNKTLLERSFSRNFGASRQQLSDRQLLALLPATVDTELIEAELLEDEQEGT